MVSRTVTKHLHLETGAKSGRGTAAQRALRRRAVRIGLLGFNILLLLAVGYFVLQSAGTPTHSFGSVAAAGSDDAMVDPLDRISSADIAVNVARIANLPQAVAVTNQADSENIQLAVAQSAESLVAKPQVVASAFKSNKDIQTYTAKPNDTATSIAAQFHVTTDSILWSNDLAGNSVTPGKLLYIPPMNGIVYVVKDGDTPEKLAEKYHASKDKIIASNDAELSGLLPGTRIIIPDGRIVPVVPRVASAGFVWGQAAGAGNMYDPGFCTWYVASKISVGNWGNANTWDSGAAAAGWTVSPVPRPGVIAQTDRGGLGHVAIVEAVSEDGTMIKYSDMNGIAGFGRVGMSDWVPASEYEHYIYR